MSRSEPCPGGLRCPNSINPPGLWKRQSNPDSQSEESKCYHQAPGLGKGVPNRWTTGYNIERCGFNSSVRFFGYFLFLVFPSFFIKYVSLNNIGTSKTTIILLMRRPRNPSLLLPYKILQVSNRVLNFLLTRHVDNQKIQNILVHDLFDNTLALGPVPSVSSRAPRRSTPSDAPGIFVLAPHRPPPLPSSPLGFASGDRIDRSAGKE